MGESDATLADPTPTWGWILPALAVALAVVCPIVAALSLDDSMIQRPGNDPDAYARIAHQLVATGQFAREPGTPTAYRLPGYVLALVPWCASAPPIAWGILLLHVAAGVVTVIATMDLARRVGADRLAASVAGVVVAIDPILLRQSTLIMSETLFTAFLASALATFVRGPAARGGVGWSIASGLLWGCAGLIRPIAWPALLALGIIALARGWMRGWLVVVLVAAAVHVPWVVRNQQVFGTPILFTTHGGYTLWLGMNPEFHRAVVQGTHGPWPSESFDRWSKENEEWTRGKSEVEADVILAGRAKQWMLHHPGDAIETAGFHVVSFWKLAPAVASHDARLLIAIFYTAIFNGALFGVLALWRGGGGTAVVLLAPIAAFTLVHTLYWSDMRMRGPLAPALAVLFVLGISFLVQTIVSLRSTPSPPPEPRDGTMANEFD